MPSPLEVRRAVTEDECLSAKSFTLANFRRSTSDALGCGEAIQESIMENLLSKDNVDWIVAYRDAEIVGTFAIAIHPPYLPGIHLQFLSVAFADSDPDREVYHALHDGLKVLISWPGCCDNKWHAYTDADNVEQIRVIAEGDAEHEGKSTNFVATESSMVPGFFECTANLKV